MTDGPQRARLVTNPIYCNVAILSVATKDLPISPKFLPMTSYCDASLALLHIGMSSNGCILLITHVLTLSATEVRIKFSICQESNSRLRTTNGVVYKVAVRNVLICREAPATYREDGVLEDAWHEEVGTVCLNHTIV